MRKNMHVMQYLAYIYTYFDRNKFVSLTRWLIKNELQYEIAKTNYGHKVKEKKQQH